MLQKAAIHKLLKRSHTRYRNTVEKSISLLAKLGSLFTKPYRQNDFTSSGERSVDQSKQAHPDFNLARVLRVVSVGHRVGHNQADGVMN